MQSQPREDWVEGYQLESLDRQHRNYIWACKKMSKTIREHNVENCTRIIDSYQILQVHSVKNSDLYNKYRARREEIRLELGCKVPELRLFHGTNHALEISRDGFKVELANENSMFGKGIYFADLSSKSNQYTFEGCNKACQEHEDVFCETCVRTMLICKVAIGKSYYPRSTMANQTAPPPGFHSVIGDPSNIKLKYHEYIIYNNFQAYPGHIVQYKIKMKQ